MEKFEEKMKAAGLSEAAIGAFRLNYEQLVAGVTGLVWLMARGNQVRRGVENSHRYSSTPSTPYGALLPRRCPRRT